MAPRLKVGDQVRIIGGLSADYGHKGEIGTIIKIDDYCFPYTLKMLNSALNINGQQYIYLQSDETVEPVIKRGSKEYNQGDD